MRLEAGGSARVSIAVHADLTSFTGRDGRRVVEPGEIVLGLGRSSSDILFALPVTLTGPVRAVDHTRVLGPEIRVREVERSLR